MARLITGYRVGRLGQLAIGCSATVLDETKQKMLLIRRTDNGRWAVPGGYMEAGESVAEACIREVWEETGLTVEVNRLLAVYSDPHRLLAYPDGNRLQLVVLHFLATIQGGTTTPGDESTAVGFFTAGEMLHLDIADFDQQRIKDGFAAQPRPLIR